MGIWQFMWHPGIICGAPPMIQRAMTSLEEEFVDFDRLDRLARWIGSGNRRQVIGGALAGITAALSGSAVSDTVAMTPDIGAEGPCGNGSIKDNRCKRNRQCCTGFCRKKKGKKPYGRCRCRKLNQGCTQDRNCCATAGQPMTCVSGTCQATASCVTAGGACEADATCCAGLVCEAGTCQTAEVCVPLGGACTTGGTACCTNPATDATCTLGICRDQSYCSTTLVAAGCEFQNGPDYWECGGEDLTGINLSGCNLSGADFFNANLTNAVMVSTNLTGANFQGSNVTGAEWGNTTCPSGDNSDTTGDTCCGEFILGQTPTGCPVE